jgi:hypothetical protein
LFFLRQRNAKWAAAAKETAGRRADEFCWEFHVAATVFELAGRCAEEFCGEFNAAATSFGLAPGYTRDEVVVAFRRLARTAHPDLGGTHEAFQTLVARRDLLLSHAADQRLRQSTPV